MKPGEIKRIKGRESAHCKFFGSGRCMPRERCRSWAGEMLLRGGICNPSATPGSTTWRAEHCECDATSYKVGKNVYTDDVQSRLHISRKNAREAGKATFKSSYEIFDYRSDIAWRRRGTNISCIADVSRKLSGTPRIIDCVERVSSNYKERHRIPWLKWWYETADLSLHLARNDYIFSAAPDRPPHVIRIRTNFAL